MRPAFGGGHIAAVGVLVGLSSLWFSACVGNAIPPRPSEAPDLGSCDAGPCPTALVSAPGCVAIDLVVADDTLFWTNKHAGTVNSVPTMGGPIKVLAAGQSSPGPLAVDGTSVFWVAGNKTIMKKPLAAGPAMVFVPASTMPEMSGNENDVNALLVDQGTLYFGRFTAALKVSTSGGTPTVIGLSPDLGKAAAFAIDATHLYQTERDHMAVTREALDGTQNGLLGNGDSVTRQHLAPDRIAVSQASLLLDTIAVVDGTVIWANYNAIDSKPIDALELDPLFSVAETQLDGSVTGFVVSGGTIYLGDAAFTKGNVVEKVPLPAADAGALATPVVIATDQLSPSQFAADATNIYWRTADCKIMRLAK